MTATPPKKPILSEHTKKNNGILLSYSIIILGTLVLFGSIRLTYAAINSSQEVGSSMYPAHDDDSLDNGNDLMEISPLPVVRTASNIPTKSIDEQLENSKENIKNTDSDPKPQVIDAEKVMIENKENTLTIKNANGIETDEAVLNRINDILETNDVTIEPDSQAMITIRNGTIEAQTALPVIVDAIKQSVSVVTSRGERRITILPEKAVTSAKVESNLTLAKKIIVTELGTQPVYEIQGLVEKKMLGLIPLRFHKTVLIAADTGSLIRTDENTTGKILEKISF